MKHFAAIGKVLRDPQNLASRMVTILVGWSLLTAFSWVGLAQFQRVMGDIVSSRFGMYGVHCDRVGTIVGILPPQPGRVYGMGSSTESVGSFGRRELSSARQKGPPLPPSPRIAPFLRGRCEAKAEGAHQTFRKTHMTGASGFERHNPKGLSRVESRVFQRQSPVLIDCHPQILRTRRVLSESWIRGYEDHAMKW